MNKNRNAEACDRFGSKTNDYLADNQGGFSVSESITSLEPIRDILERLFAPGKAGKVVRLYRCFGCKRHFPASRMPSALVVCRECLNSTRGKGRLAKINQLDRITNEFRSFLRGRLEAK